MRCSECKKDLKPIVALDIDGTLGDYHGHFIEFAESWLGYELPKHRGYNGKQTFWQYLGLDLPLYREVKLAYRQGGLKRTMPTIIGARTLAQELRLNGAEIWICTTRPYLRLDNVDPDTRSWLERNNIPYDYMIYGDDKYRRLEANVEKNRVVGVLDDLPEQVEDAESRGMRPIMVAQPHNRHYRTPGVGRRHYTVHSLYDAKEELIDRVVCWYEDEAMKHIQEKK